MQNLESKLVLQISGTDHEFHKLEVVTKPTGLAYYSLFKNLLVCCTLVTCVHHQLLLLCIVGLVWDWFLDA